MKQIRVFQLLCIGLLAIGLAGCSGEPSEPEIKTALKKEIQSINKKAADLAGSDLAEKFKTELHSVKKLACKESPTANGYVCDVEMELSVPVFGRTTKTTTIRLIESDDGWVKVETLSN